MTRIWPLMGGIHPPQNKHQTSHLPIGRLTTPQKLYISLHSDRGPEVGEVLRPLVSAGERVLKGQMIAQGPGAQAVPVHASTSGTIGALVQRPLHLASGALGAHIELINDGHDQWCALNPCEDPFSLERAVALSLIQQAGICGMGGAGFPTAVKLASDQPIHTLILNGTECEPYITADDRLMQEQPQDILQGALLCAHLVGATSIKLAIEDNKPAAIKAIAAVVAQSPSASVEIIVVPTIYPSGGSKQLVQILTGQQIPSGQQAARLGLMVINVATVRAVWRALRWGEPLIERVTTFTGASLSKPQNLWVPLGTPADYALMQVGWQQEDGPLILGGPMMGFGLNRNTSLGKISNCVIAPSREEMPPTPAEAPCIRCGQCDSVCPAQLLPQQLFWYAKAQDPARLHTHNLFDCIECGACSYVCPSTIPLVQYYREAKADIRAQQEQKRKADQARHRFEARLARLAEQEAEKDRKRVSRQAAALAINTQLAQQHAAPEPSPAQPASEELTAKLQRHQQSAQERIERLQQQLAQEQDPARQEKLTASIKQAQLRLREAQAQHAQLQTSAVKAIEKLSASPQQLANQAIATLHKQLAITEAKRAEAESQNSTNLNALTIAVEKLRQKITQAESQSNTNASAHAHQPTPVDPATLAAAQQALARLAAKKNQTSEEKHQALIESLEKRITQLQLRIASAEPDKIAVLEESLATLKARLQELCSAQ